MTNSFQIIWLDLFGVFTTNQGVNSTQIINIRVVNYFKVFVLDKWEVHLYERMPFLHVGTLGSNFGRGGGEGKAYY